MFKLVLSIQEDSIQKDQEIGILNPRDVKRDSC